MEPSPTTITNVYGLLALNSRGTPTVKAYVETACGARGWAISPSGASTGEHEAVEIRDGGRRWKGKGVSRALAILEDEVAPRLIGLDATNQAFIDRLMITLDGTPNKSRIGGNVTTAVSLAVARAASESLGLEVFEYIGGKRATLLPTPLLNVINGGVHAGNELDLQEFMIIPVGAGSFVEAMRMAVEVYLTLKETIKEKYGPGAVNVGDEGGFAPPLKKSSEALDLLVEAIKRAGYEAGTDFYLGVDAAASQFYDAERKVYVVEGRELSGEELLDYYAGLVGSYPIKYLEDPFDENDWDMFKLITGKLGNKILIVGDDLYVTNVRFLRKGIELGATNAALVKVNQVGTLTETLEYVALAQESGLRAVVSHRSGDSEDPFIADLAVGVRAGFIKTGAPARSERTSKYNRLIEIEALLAGSGEYAGARFFP
ncbi:MAG: phosphopyruvate hydratase [Desulfurococcales archaeon]|nr:phosphopyruvate hydratase [Desulfurococcales archaeon]